MVIIEKLDRLARDLMVRETITADLRKYGFELVSVAEPDLTARAEIGARQVSGVGCRVRGAPESRSELYRGFGAAKGDAAKTIAEPEPQSSPGTKPEPAE
jgi:hypothetical protein